MTRRHVVLLAVAFAASATWMQHASASATSLRIRGVDVHAFPQVTVSASITGTQIDGECARPRSATETSSSTSG